MQRTVYVEQFQDLLMLVWWVSWEGQVLMGTGLRLPSVVSNRYQSVLHQKTVMGSTRSWAPFFTKLREQGLSTTRSTPRKERWQELNNYFGRTKLKIDFGKPLIDIVEYLKKPPTT
ncbi:hypothetical protein MRX96_015945 [Rhipicephalus microplus]